MRLTRRKHLSREPLKGGGSALRVLSFVVVVGMFLSGFSVQTIKAQAYPIKPEIQYNDGIPDDIREYCEEIGAEFDICPELLESIAYQESRFIPNVKNKNCWGLMQVNVKVHAERIKKCGYVKEDMLESYPCIYVAADLLADLFEHYGDDDPIILMLYSGAGWDAVELYKEQGTMTDYCFDVLTRSAEYERIHGK